MISGGLRGFNGISEAFLMLSGSVTGALEGLRAHRFQRGFRWFQRISGCFRGVPELFQRISESWSTPGSFRGIQGFQEVPETFQGVSGMF